MSESSTGVTPYCCVCGWWHYPAIGCVKQVSPTVVKKKDTSRRIKHSTIGTTKRRA